jgi:hypothetical protein
MYETIAEINKNYNGNWVFLIKCKKDKNGSVFGGEVVISSESRDKVIREMSKYSLEESDTYLRYAGNIPEGVSVIL